MNRILLNEKYCGDILLQKQIHPSYMEDKTVINRGQEVQYFIEDHHEAIISKDDWNAVQSKLESRRTKVKVYGVSQVHKTKEQPAFTRKIFCGDCGNYFISKRVNSRGIKKVEYYIWICRAYGGYVPGVECHMESFHEAEIENAFMAMLMDMKKNRNALTKEVSQSG